MILLPLPWVLRLVPESRVDTVKVEAADVALAFRWQGTQGPLASACPGWSPGSVPQSVLFSLCVSRAAISRDPFYEMLAARKKKVSSTKRH